MMLPPRFLDEVRDRLSLTAIIGRRVKLTRRGREHTGLCPFHNEKSPSFTVSDERGFFHCFGCGAHGDVISFEMQANRLTFIEAVEKLAAEAGLSLPVVTAADKHQEDERKTLRDVMEMACTFFQNNLMSPVGQQARAYLEQRGIHPETIQRFRLGYAPDSRDALRTALLSASVPENLLITAGLLIKPDHGGVCYDRFRGRLIFPVADRRGQVIAFGGRILGEGMPKYLNSPDTPLFHKGSVVYNHALAQPAARETNQLIVCEGYMDVIALDQGGLPYAVAPLGTALTEQQLEIAWKMVPEPCLCFDGDTAGQRAALRAAARAVPLLKPGYSLRFAMMNGGEDPDSLLRTRGKQAMEQILNAAIPLADILWGDLVNQYPSLSTPEQRAALERAALKVTDDIADPMVRDHYRQDFRSRLRQLFYRGPKKDQKYVKSAGNNRMGGRFNANFSRPLSELETITGVPGLPRPPALVDARTRQEQIMLATLVNHPSLIEQVGERLGSLTLSNKELDKVRLALLKLLGCSSGLDSQAVALHLSLCGVSQSAEKICSPAVYAHAAFARADSATEAEALQGWEHVFSLYQRCDLETRLSVATRDVTTQTSDRTVRAHATLKQQELTIKNDTLEQGDDPALF